MWLDIGHPCALHDGYRRKDDESDNQPKAYRGVVVHHPPPVGTEASNPCAVLSGEMMVASRAATLLAAVVAIHTRVYHAHGIGPAPLNTKPPPAKVRVACRASSPISLAR